MNNKISLSVDHHNAKRMEFFLNKVEDELKQIPYEWSHLKLADRITDSCQFISTTANHPLTISIFFCDSYFDANEIAKANAFPYSPIAKWSVNGDLLYVVASDDEEKVSDVLSLFAGEE